MFPLSSFFLFSAISFVFVCAKLKPSKLDFCKDKIVELHDAARAKVTPPAKNMKKMAWDVGLARLAQQSADEKFDKFETGIHEEKFRGERFPETPHTVHRTDNETPRNPSTPVYRDWRQRAVSYLDEDARLLRPDGKPYHQAFGDTWVGENIIVFHERDGETETYYPPFALSWGYTEKIWETERAGSVAAWSNVTSYTYGCHGKQKYGKRGTEFRRELDNRGFVGEEFLQIVWAETSHVGCGLAQGIWQDKKQDDKWLDHYGHFVWKKGGSCSYEEDSNCTLVTMIVCNYWPNVKITDKQHERPYLASCEKCPECEECCAADQANTTDAPTTTVARGSAEHTRPNFAVVVALVMTVGWAGGQ